MKTIAELVSDPYMAAGIACCILGYTIFGIMVIRWN